jgi:hypothetical protein
MAKKPKEELSDEEAERRATEALRRALGTAYRPQKEMVGATPRKTTRSVKKKRH